MSCHRYSELKRIRGMAGRVYRKPGSMLRSSERRADAAVEILPSHVYIHKYTCICVCVRVRCRCISRVAFEVTLRWRRATLRVVNFVGAMNMRPSKGRERSSAFKVLSHLAGFFTRGGARVRPQVVFEVRFDAPRLSFRPHAKCKAAAAAFMLVLSRVFFSPSEPARFIKVFTRVREAELCICLRLLYFYGPSARGRLYRIGVIVVGGR